VWQVIKGLYTSAQGLAALNRQHEATANNLANANTSGYKRDRMVSTSFPEMLFYRLNDPAQNGKDIPVGNISMGVRTGEVFTDYSGGAKRQSDNPLAVAIEGDGFFVVNTPQGERYTKNGEFNVDATGRVITHDGHFLQGQKGDIVLTNPDFQVDRQGRVFSNGAEIDRLRIVSFTTPLTKEGSSLFAGENPVEMAQPVLCQGYVEESNVQPVEEMIKMIEVMRSYEANQKVMQTIDGTLDKAVNEVGRV
jgi:flagellar basal-body rod protein FlgF